MPSTRNHISNYSVIVLVMICQFQAKVITRNGWLSTGMGFVSRITSHRSIGVIMYLITLKCDQAAMINGSHTMPHEEIICQF